jgi:hypothetical protein
LDLAKKKKSIHLQKIKVSHYCRSFKKWTSQVLKAFHKEALLNSSEDWLGQCEHLWLPRGQVGSGTSQVWWYMSVIPTISVVKGQPGVKKLKTLSEKITKVKKTGGMAQAIEYLPSKHKALR